MQHPYFSKLNQAGGLLFSHRDVQNTENEKNFACLKIAKTDRKGQFRVGENDSGQKIHFFVVKPVFQG